jgi:hypothetical protein
MTGPPGFIYWVPQRQNDMPPVGYSGRGTLTAT